MLEYQLNCIKIEDFPIASKPSHKLAQTVSSTPPRYPWGCTVRGEPIKFNCLNLECDHQLLKQLEPKNLSKRAKFC